jgi:hypothetical protein
MSTLWTPGGEHPVPKSSDEGGAPPGRGEPPGRQPTSARRETAGREPTEAELEAEMAQLQAELANTPVEVVVANHAFGLFQLAALHLSQRPPHLEEARLAIDALTALVEGLAGRLGDAEPQLKDGIAQLRMAFVQIRGSQDSS